MKFHTSPETVGEYSTVTMMIFYTFSIIATLLLPTVTLAATRPAPATVHYELDLRLLPAEHRIEGTAQLIFPAPELPPTLQVAPGATVSAVRVDQRPVAFSLRAGRLEIKSPQGRKAGNISIDYSATFNDPVPRDTVGIEDPSFGVRATILTEGAFLSDSVAWFPQLAGRPGVHRVRLSAPGGMMAVTAGRLIGQNTVDGRTWIEWDNDFPLTGLALSAGHFQLVQEQLDGIQLLTFLTADNAALAPGYLAAMRRHLVFYRDLLGPYPFTKFAVVENFLPTGYGMPSWTLLGKNVVRLPFLLDTSLPHEIVHSWWGNATKVDYQRGNWAEGLTTYLADYLLKERSNSGEALEYRRKLLRDYTSLATDASDFPLTAFSGRTSRAEQAVGYGKAAMVFHQLRQTVGDDVFWKTLRRLAAGGAGKTVGWDDIERSFTEAAGTDLRWFFAQWVERRGAPELALADIKSTATGKGWTVSGTLRQQGAYRLTIPVRLTTAGGADTVQSVRLSDDSSSFRFDVAAPPAVLEVDPDSTLFRRLDLRELPATVNDLMEPRRPLVVVAVHASGLPAASRDLLKGLHWDTAEIIDESDLSPAQLTGRDTLYLGWPQRPELRPELPDGLVVTGNQRGDWKITGAPPAGDALFAVLAGRQQQGSSQALLLAHDPGAAGKIAAKISHYGRYSLLLFESGRNLAKTTWVPATSPLRHVFTKEKSP